MKLYVFDNVQDMTHSYHSGGGLVVVATDRDAAATLAVSRGVKRLTEEELASAIEYEVGDVEEAVYIFPDAGCC